MRKISPLEQKLKVVGPVNKMKILVTGASGYLGGKLCGALLSRGYSVRVFVRRTSDLSSLPSVSDGSLELAYGDVTDYSSLLTACSGCQIVFHVAAVVEPWLPDPSVFTKVNIGGLKNLLRAYKELESIEKIIYTSSFFALGSTDGYVADENQIHSGEKFCTEYEKSKVVADKIALEAAAEGVPIVAVYPGVIYGPGKLSTGNIVARLLVERFNWRLPGYIGNGNDRFSFSHVDDVVEGHIGALNKGQPGERYLLTGENASFKEVFDLAAVITNTSKPRFNIPLSVVEVYGWILVFISRITGNLPLLCPPTVYVLRNHWAYSCEKAKTELGYAPRGLKEGLLEMLPWLKSSVTIRGLHSSPALSAGEPASGETNSLPELILANPAVLVGIKLLHEPHLEFLHSHLSSPVVGNRLGATGNRHSLSCRR